jgi:hypothetical protein
MNPLKNIDAELRRPHCLVLVRIEAIQIDGARNRLVEYIARFWVSESRSKEKNQTPREKMSLRVLVLVAISVCLTSASAGQITIQNPSFETPSSLSIQNCPSAADSSWTFSDCNSGIWNPTGFVSSVPDGNQVMFLSFGDEGTDSDVFQTLGVTLEADSIYNLSYYVGARVDQPFASYTVSLKAGDTVLASDSGGAPTAGGFVLRSFSFDSSTANLSDIGKLLTIDVTANHGQAEFDLFQLTGPGGDVPEPLSCVLAGGGIALLAWKRRRRV